MPDTDPTVMIEQATVADVDAITELWVELAREQRSHNSRLQAAANRDVIRATLAHHAVDGTLVVARLGETIVGFVSFEVEEGGLELSVERGRVQNLYVAPHARGRGIGSSLLEAAEEVLEDAGVDVVAIEAMADNEGARRLYERREYEPHRLIYERAISDEDVSDPKSDSHSKEDG